MSEDKLHILADECVEMTEADFNRASAYFRARKLCPVIHGEWRFTGRNNKWLTEVKQEQVHHESTTEGKE